MSEIVSAGLLIFNNEPIDHAEGYVARWTNIDPGADGIIVIRAEAGYHGTSARGLGIGDRVERLHQTYGAPQYLVSGRQGHGVEFHSSGGSVSTR